MPADHELPNSAPPPELQAALAVAFTGFGEALRVLVTRRPAGKRFAGLWEWPGGKIETAETPVEAACRELLEETGLEADPRMAQPIASHRDEGPPSIEFHLFAIAFDEPAPPRCIACSDARWLDLPQAMSLPCPPANAAINRLVAAWAQEARSAPSARNPSPAR